MPKGRIFVTTRDELIECAALIRAIRAGELERLEIPSSPLDVLAQQIVAEAACEEWREDDLFALERNLGTARPPGKVRIGSNSRTADLSRDAVEGIGTDKILDAGRIRKKQRDQVEAALAKGALALNLFDRAAQQRRPVISVQAAVYDSVSPKDPATLVAAGLWPETSSVTLGRARGLAKEAAGAAKALRYDEGELELQPASYVQAGDTLLVPCTVAYLHRVKGLCFGDGSGLAGVREIVLSSQWLADSTVTRSVPRQGGRRQALLEHVKAVMEKTHDRFGLEGSYRRALVSVLRALEPQKDATGLADAVAGIATVAAAFHDLGKADERWQRRARQIDPGCSDDLIGRTAAAQGRIGIPHTPPGYLAILRACQLLIGPLVSSEHLVRAIALASVRHHSSFVDPSMASHQFFPDPKAEQFVKEVLEAAGAPAPVIEQADEILLAAREIPSKELVPLLLPNDDLFPIYALVGRAILMADREDAAGELLEKWREGN